MKSLPEHKESLWFLIVSPMVWAGHFMLCYLTAAIWCAKFATMYGSIRPVRWAIAVYTVVALLVIAANGWSGYRRHRLGAETVPHDADTPGDRHRFLGFATLLLALLSAVATIFAALVVMFFEDCR
jgi:hypothetical protein